MILSFELKSDPYAVIDHETKILEKCEDRWRWFIVLLDRFDDSHTILG
jgi:hypothetical protein